MRQRRPASAALTAIAATRPADRWTQLLARTPKRELAHRRAQLMTSLSLLDLTPRGAGTCQRGTSRSSPGSWCRPQAVPCAFVLGAVPVGFTSSLSIISNNSSLPLWRR